MKNKFVVSITIVVVAIISGIGLIMVVTSTNPVTIMSGIKSRPVLHDSTLAIELVAEGLESPTSMSFVDNGSILVLEKNSGRVRVVSGDRMLNEPAIEKEVATGAEQGLLGIATWKGINDTSVFLYLTEKYEDMTRNRVYKYTLDDNQMTLENQTLVLDLPGDPGPFHNGGKISLGPTDGYLYVAIGDVSAGGGLLDNQIRGHPPNDRSVIIRVDKDSGLPPDDNPFFNYDGDMENLRRYFAYGIRNSFGMDFEPITGKLWITENGDNAYDEINMVNPGFNSGWHKVMGPIGRTNITVENDLMIFNGSKYDDPVFSWYAPVGVTDIEFFNSGKLGDKYKNNIFVGDINNGNLYFFKVNQDRTGLIFDDPRLFDLVADPVQEGDNSETSSLIFGEGFGRITDIETGPDGFLYVLTYEDGNIYRITKEIT
ncbi:MAG: PQQ-dependent sugar dehydrogenase [Thermoproteota archaeon]|nr:PQQ-dependent sugar dehydrogenase [Thermoproteota archaeon]